MFEQFGTLMKDYDRKSIPPSKTIDSLSTGVIYKTYSIKGRAPSSVHVQKLHLWENFGPKHGFLLEFLSTVSCLLEKSWTRPPATFF